MRPDLSSQAAEFPNDNPALHRGITWVCRDVLGPPEAERAGQPDVGPDRALRTNEGQEDDAVTGGRSTVPAPPDDSFTTLLCTLTDAALAVGSAHAAAMVPKLFLEGRVDSVSAEITGALAEGNIAIDGRATEAFTRTTEAWRAILSGASDDLSGCGGVTLDEWGAEVLARLMGMPSRAAHLRRELRTRGVAAFGLIEAA